MPTILIVDDEFGLADMVCEILSTLGHDVDMAMTGMLALAKVAERRPDLILLDFMMPVMSGIDVLNELKARAETRDIPVVMMSAAGSGVIPDEARALVAGFLEKPFTIDQLLATIGRCLSPSASAWAASAKRNRSTT